MIKLTKVLQDKLSNLPDCPGIYKMLDASGSIIYIGKSKCLKKRVKSYFVESPKWEKVIKMQPFIKDLEIVITDTHLEAMLLECKLIKEIQPYFNVQMKNDNRYVYAKVGMDERSAPLSVVYQREEHCYGPFRRKHTLQQMIDALKNIYPIQKNKQKYEFEYHVLPISMTSEEKEKNRLVMNELFLDVKKMERFVKQLEKKMQEAAVDYRFEMASKYRDILQAIQYLKSGINRNREFLEKSILLKLEISDGYKLIFVAKGQVIDKQCFTRITGQDQETFVERAIKKSNAIDIKSNEKSNIDYHDILLGEIMSLPDESVILLEDISFSN
ncbi:GIY-YIG nuclease family protein [Bacillus massiliigorillae]|uniref:GIY-YIG nuclease family protein n=1 Tax=Bacillus massiliigorillae TaxID=1243664 RepID=UPI0003A8D74C|nr:GIY-YIG nuclease family protein [Bacillus massiliigorillae]